MAKKQSWTKQAGVTPSKLALIAVLAVVLVGVLYRQFAPESKPPLSVAPPPVFTTSVASAPSASPPVAAVAPPDQSAPRKRTGAVASWSSPEFTPVVDFDPFALPASFPQPQHADEQVALAQGATAAEEASAQQAALEAERTKSEGELQGLKQQGVAVIIKKNKKYVALVGDQEVQVGDEINGFKVIAIDADGAIVAKDLSP